MTAVSSTTPVTIDYYAALAERIKRPGGFFWFVKTFWSTIIAEEPVWNWHIPYICGELEDYGFDVKNRVAKKSDLIINIPPGTSKSTICTIMFPVWLWVIDPSIRIITGSCADSLSTDHAVKSRDILRSAMFKKMFPYISIKDDQNNKTHIKNDQLGERLAITVGGTVIGFHAHVIIIDDPLDPRRAASAVELKTAANFMDQTLSQRKVNKTLTPTILVMQRLSALDPTGHILAKKDKKVQHINLPATLTADIQPPELALMYKDGLLDGVRLGPAAIAEAKTDLGSYGYAGQMMQKPSPEGGGKWKEWFIPIPDSLFPSRAELDEYGTDWDTAYGENTANAASASVTSGLHKLDKRMYIDDIGVYYLEFPELIKQMKETASPHYIEAKASGKSAKQTLSRASIAAIEVQVNGDKIARASDATPHAEAGQICVRKSLLDKIYNDVEQGILQFPNGPKQDLADTIAQAILRHFGVKKLQRPKSHY